MRNTGPNFWLILILVHISEHSPVCFAKIVTPDYFRCLENVFRRSLNLKIESNLDQRVKKSHLLPYDAPDRSTRGECLLVGVLCRATRRSLRQPGHEPAQRHDDPRPLARRAHAADVARLNTPACHDDGRPSLWQCSPSSRTARPTAATCVAATLSPSPCASFPSSPSPCPLSSSSGHH